MSIQLIYKIKAKGTLLSKNPPVGHPKDPVVMDIDLSRVGGYKASCDLNPESMEFIATVDAEPEVHQKIIDRGANLLNETQVQLLNIALTESKKKKILEKIIQKELEKEQ